jgi:hypothetical protein
MDVSEIIKEYGAYYIQGSQNADRVRTLMLQDFETYQYMTPLKTNDTVYQLAKATIGSLLQPFKNKFSPSAQAKIVPNSIPLFKIKVDVSENPDDVEANWLGFLASDDVNRKQWPFVRWYIEKLLIPKMMEDLENAIYNAVRVEANPSTDVPGDVLEILNGLKYQLLQGIGKGLNEITLSVLTPSNIFDQVEIFRNKISAVYKKKDLKYFMSPDNADAYKADKRNSFPYFPQDDFAKVDFSPHMVVGLPSMYGSNVIFATPKDNLLYITKKDKNLTKFNLEEAKRQVDFLADTFIGLGFGINEAVFASIPDAEKGSGSGS